MHSIKFNAGDCISAATNAPKETQIGAMTLQGFRA
jgi:hypothetical protein